MEGDAGTRQLNPTDAEETPDKSVAVSGDNPDDTESPAEDGVTTVPSEDDGRRPPRLGRGWLTAICAVLLLLGAGAGVGGYLALRSHEESAQLAENEAAAVAAARDCVAATHAPDAAAMTASQAKILECSTGDFGVQAGLYGGLLVDAYRAAQVQVQVSDMRAAVEKHNADGSIDVLVAVRVKVTNSESADQEQGYRLRVQMAPDDGTYKVARLDQVTS
uniref:Putative conserved MCE associated membrane protein n=2 Tax=unclassified Mycobacterium TaxID=2642494 RepID=A0A5Q5BDQ8_MYCSS